MESIVMNQETEIKKNAWGTLLGIGIASIIMLFAGLTSAYIVRVKEGNWTEFALPHFFLYSTITILISSVTMQWSLVAVKKNQQALFKTMLFITLGLGLCFILFQFLGWNEMVKQGLFLVADNPSTSFVYILTGLHLAHLFGGIIFMIVVSIKAILDKYNSENRIGVGQCAIYWHFLGALWLYLYVFFNYVK